jgi:hypothetical protein
MQNVTLQACSRLEQIGCPVEKFTGAKQEIARCTSFLISASRRMSLGSMSKSPVALRRLNCTGSSSSASSGKEDLNSAGTRSLQLTRADNHVDQFTTCERKKFQSCFTAKF